MFNRELDRLTLTSEIANEVFPNINGVNFNYDTSFLATLRALVAPRMAKKDTLYLDVRTYTYREAALKEYGDEDSIRMLTDGIGNNTILVCGFSGRESDNKASMKVVDNAFLRFFDDYEEIKDLRAFAAKQQTDMRFYINEKTKSVVIFIEGINLRLYHFAQSFVSRFLPWYFKKKPLEDNERELVKTLIQKTATGYQQLIEEFANKYDFRSIKIKKMIGGVANRTKVNQLMQVRDNIAVRERKLDEIREKFRVLAEEMQDLRTRECGLTYQIDNAEDDTELVEYFIHNKNINVINAGNDGIEIIVGTTIDSYDPDLLDRMKKNKGSYLYKGYDVNNEVFADVNARKKMIDALFGDDAIMGIKVCAYYNLRFSGGVRVSMKYAYPKPEYEDFLTNPHFYFFACIGTYEGVINDALRKGDYMYAVEQCVISAQTINLTEGSQTVAPFLGQVFNSDKKIIRMPDGTSCTPVEAYNWLLAQENNNQEATENV